MQNIQDHLMKEKKYIPFRKTYTSKKIKCDRKGNVQDILHIEQKKLCLLDYVNSKGWFKITCNMCC